MPLPSLPGGPGGPLRFRPIFKEKVWGGRRLETVLGKRLPGSGPYGECWEISDCGADVSVVDGGAFDGWDLRRLLARASGEVLGRPAREFPLLLKTIDTSAPLSVQLHPGDEDAALLGPGLRGKTEAWIILEAAPGAKIVHGLVPGTDREAFFEAATVAASAPVSGRAAGSGPSGVERLFAWREVRAGDVVFLPAGTIHAIGADILLMEVQESSDITYRIYDWGRPGLDGRLRALHLREARAVRARPAAAPPRFTNLFSGAAAAAPAIEPVLSCAHFRIDALRLGPPGDAARLRTRDGTGDQAGDRRGFLVLAGVAGRALLEEDGGAGALEVGPGGFVLLPACAGDLLARAAGGSFTGLLVREGLPV